MGLQLGAGEASGSARAALSGRASLLSLASPWALARGIGGATEAHARLSLGAAKTTGPTMALGIVRLARPPWGAAKGSWGVSGKQPMTFSPT